MDSKEGKLINRQELNNILWKLLQEGATLPLEAIGGRTKFLSLEGEDEHSEYVITIGNERSVIKRPRARSEIHTLAIRMFEALPVHEKGEER
ncbi:MAG: hypothetical protein HYW97_02245 [Candidatus Wildermuthbacteria bacterium]|nr:hypothetical protein [Candidatus Wildermuthbacteria bacterium]